MAEVEESWKNSPHVVPTTGRQSEHVTWVFPGNEMTEGPELTVEWFDGQMLPPQRGPRSLYRQQVSLGSRLAGWHRSALLQNVGAGPLLLPAEKFKSYPRPKPEPGNHYHHFVDACLGGEKRSRALARRGR